MASSGRSLPEEIITEILKKLPVESLVRFRFVSKSWYSIITDPRFAILQYCDKQDRLLLLSRNPPCHLSKVNCEALVGGYGVGRVDDALVNIDLNIPRKITNREILVFHVWGSCNGLICFGTQKYPSDWSLEDTRYWSDGGSSIYLLNPSTRDLKLLPQPTSIDGYMWDECYYGFGYDKSIDDYKLTRVFPPSIFNPVEGETVIDVLRLKTKAWERRNQDFRFKIDRAQANGILLNGALHWSLGYSESDHRQELTALDLTEEKLQAFPRPELDRGFGSRWLGVLGGCLCLCSRLRDEGTTNVWLMKEYGVRASWTKLMSLGPEIFIFRTLSSFKPLCFSSDGRAIIALVDGSMLVRTSIKSQTSSFLKYCRDAVAYTGSLISIG